LGALSETGTGFSIEIHCSLSFSAKAGIISHLEGATLPGGLSFDSERSWGAFHEQQGGEK
jgi:hypothetical protein